MHTDIINHVDILESNKPNQYSLGKTFIIGEEMFEDLNEIIANYISSQWWRMHEIYWLTRIIVIRVVIGKRLNKL